MRPDDTPGSVAKPSGPTRPGNVGDALGQAAKRLLAAGSETPRLDAEVLLGHVLRVDRSTLAAHPDAPLGAGQAEAYEACLERRGRGEPVAYIRGLKEFHGAAFAVDGRVLIPRPETETLVELAVAHVRDVLTSAPRPAGAPPYRAWDVGTGSGAIAIAIALELRRRRYGNAVHIWATDCSPDALAVATLNVVSHGLADLFTIAQGDLTDVAPSPGPVDLLAANLPYIPSGDLPGLPLAASFEPREALDGGADGLDVIRRLLAQLPAALAPGGVALLEIGSDQTTALASAVSGLLPGWICRFYPDLGGSPRVARLERASSGDGRRGYTGDADSGAAEQA